MQGDASSPSAHHLADFYEGPWPKLSQPLVVLAAFSAHQDLQPRFTLPAPYRHPRSSK